MRKVATFITVGLFLMTSALMAQVTFVELDTASTFGITAEIGMYGFAWGDYDSDGDLDLFVTGTGNESILYRNDMSDSSVFVDMTALGALRDTTGGYACGASFADFDNDGDIDILSVDAGLKLYQNDDNIFTDVAATNGLNLIDPTERLWQAACADFDGDGDLDIALAGADTKALATRIIRNDEGTYVEAGNNLIGFDLILESWNPMWVDVDNDGDMDLFMPTIRTPNEPCALLENIGGEFAISDPNMTGLYALSAITSSWADYDNDGDMDLYVIPYTGDDESGAKLFRNNGNWSFTNVAPDLGLDSTYGGLPRGCLWADYDNDGDQDLLVTKRGAPHILWNNDGTGVFTRDVTSAEGIPIDDTRQGQFVDYDNDGFLDLYTGGQSSKKHLIHNEGNSNHWVGIKLQGVTNNTAGIGARIKVVSGSLSQIRDIQASAGHMSNGYVRGQFGLGTNTTIDSVVVLWPNGVRDVDTSVEIDQYHLFIEGLGISAIDHKNPTVVSDFALFQNFPNPFNPVTTISFRLPVRSDVRLVLVNMLGEEIQVIENGSFSAGTHNIQLNASQLATGMYFYKLETQNFVDVKKLLLLK